MFYSLALSLNISVWKPWGISWFVLHPLFIGPLVLILNTTAYTAEIFYGALRAVPRGEARSRPRLWHEPSPAVPLGDLAQYDPPGLAGLHQ